MKTTLSIDPVIYVIFIDLIVRDSNHTDTHIFFIYYINACIIINLKEIIILYIIFFVVFIF